MFSVCIVCRYDRREMDWIFSLSLFTTVFHHLCFPPLRISEWLIDIVKLHKQQDSGRCLRTTRSVLIHVNILGDDSLSRKHFEADTTVLRTHKCILGCTILSKNRNQNNTCQSSFAFHVNSWHWCVNSWHWYSTPSVHSPQQKWY